MNRTTATLLFAILALASSNAKADQTGPDWILAEHSTRLPRQHCRAESPFGRDARSEADRLQSAQ